MIIPTDVYSKDANKLEPIPKSEVCTDREHNPPQHMVIPYGMQLRHKCPSCGREQVVRAPQISY